MRAKQLVTLAGGLLAAVVSGGAIHGSAPPRYANWTQVAEELPCDKFEKDGRDVKVVGTITVDGKPYEHHTITDEKLVKMIEDRCPLKHG